MRIRACWKIVLLCLLLHGCRQAVQEPVKVLTIPLYPGATILAIDPAAPDATPGFTYHKTVFETPDSPAVVLAWYADAMQKEGWRTVIQLGPKTRPSATYSNPSGCPNTQTAWVIIVAENPGGTRVELGLREGKCRS